MAQHFGPDVLRDGPQHVRPPGSERQIQRHHHVPKPADAPVRLVGPPPPTHRKVHPTAKIGHAVSVRSGRLTHRFIRDLSAQTHMIPVA